MAYPSLENIDDAWLERALAGVALQAPSPYMNSNWSVFDSSYTSRPTKASYFYEGTSKYQKPTVAPPPSIPSSAFVDASSPDAWAPRTVPQASSPIPIKQALIPPSEELCSTSGASSPVKRPDIETELNKQNLYKTELCRNWLETGQCRYGNRCQFAHGEHEMRDVLRHPKYKTEICRTFHTTGTCSYGKRCRFVHHPNEMRVVDGQDALLTFNQQIGLLKLGGSPVQSPPSSPKLPKAQPSLRLTTSSDLGTNTDLPTPPTTPSRTANTSPSSPPPSPMKTNPSPHTTSPSTPMSSTPSPTETTKTEVVEKIITPEEPPHVEETVITRSTPAISEPAAEEYNVSDQTLKKSSAYRLPFFAKLHSWKKK